MSVERVKVAVGLKAHSGWAALVAVTADQRGEIHVVDRRRLDLVDEKTAAWAKQPYHAAEMQTPKKARDLVKRGIDLARRGAVRELSKTIELATSAGYEIVECAVLVPEPMPDWTTEEILAVHFRMHKAEGVLFPDALVRAAGACELKVSPIPEKRLGELAERALGLPLDEVTRKFALLGKSVGPPWRKDQKNAALAAAIALFGRENR